MDPLWQEPFASPAEPESSLREESDALEEFVLARAFPPDV